MQKTFSIKQAHKYGFQAVFNNFFLVCVIWFVIIGFALFSGALTYFGMKKDMYASIILFRFITGLIFTAIEFGILRITLEIYSKGSSSLVRLVAPLFAIGMYIIASVLFKLMVFGGLLLLIVPGLMWMVRFGFYDLYIADIGCGPIQALKYSSVLTSGARWQVFYFILACISLFFVSVVTIVGPLFVIPAIYMARVYVYRKLMVQEETEEIGIAKYW